jgi:Holliday junction resolvasome RuvABC endonuclease subunit
MKVMGVDCSSYSVACTILSSQDQVSTVTVFGGQQDFDRRVEVIFKEFSKTLSKYKPEAVFIEGAIYLKNVKTTLMIARVIDMVIANCISKNIYYQVVDNKSWKKDIISSGNATKDQIKSFVETKWRDQKDKFSSQDLMDAAAIALYGWRRMNNE